MEAATFRREQDAHGEVNPANQDLARLFLRPGQPVHHYGEPDPPIFPLHPSQSHLFRSLYYGRHTHFAPQLAARPHFPVYVIGKESERSSSESWTDQEQ